MCHLGDPHEDLAWSFARNWRSGTTPEKIGNALDPAEAIAEWEATSGLHVDPECLRWWQLFTHVKANAIWTTAAHEFSAGRRMSSCSGPWAGCSSALRRSGRSKTWGLRHETDPALVMQAA
jgi:aminoglycoside phosphotransferase (APT) family kinase protein